MKIEKSHINFSIKKKVIARDSPGFLYRQEKPLIIDTVTYMLYNNFFQFFFLHINHVNKLKKSGECRLGERMIKLSRKSQYRN